MQWGVFMEEGWTTIETKCHCGVACKGQGCHCSLFSHVPAFASADSGGHSCLSGPKHSDPCLAPLLPKCTHAHGPLPDPLSPGISHRLQLSPRLPPAKGVLSTLAATLAPFCLLLMCPCSLPLGQACVLQQSQE